MTKLAQLLAENPPDITVVAHYLNDLLELEFLEQIDAKSPRNRFRS